MTQPTPCRLRRRWAFTLLELCLVLLIAGILAAVGIARLGRLSIAMAEGERVARRLVADIRCARSQAITTVTNHYLLFVDGGSGYTSYAVYRVEAGGDVQVEPPRAVADSVSLTGSATRAEFTPQGEALATYSFGVTSPGHSYSITVVAATGTAILEEP